MHTKATSHMTLSKLKHMIPDPRLQALSDELAVERDYVCKLIGGTAMGQLGGWFPQPASPKDTAEGASKRFLERHQAPCSGEAILNIFSKDRVVSAQVRVAWVRSLDRFLEFHMEPTLRPEDPDEVTSGFADLTQRQ